MFFSNFGLGLGVGVLWRGVGLQMFQLKGCMHTSVHIEHVTIHCMPLYLRTSLLHACLVGGSATNEAKMQGRGSQKQLQATKLFSLSPQVLDSSTRWSLRGGREGGMHNQQMHVHCLQLHLRTSPLHVCLVGG